jgi:hypothetical protein
LEDPEQNFIHITDNDGIETLQIGSRFESVEDWRTPDVYQVASSQFRVDSGWRNPEARQYSKWLV